METVHRPTEKEYREKAFQEWIESYDYLTTDGKLSKRVLEHAFEMGFASGIVYWDGTFTGLNDY